MPRAPRSLMWWPGLARLWATGDVGALCQAGGFAALANTMLLAVFLWPGLLSPLIRGFGCGGTAIWWCLGVWWNRRFLLQWSIPNESDAPDLTARLQEAQVCYLRGRWSEAETLLRLNLRASPRDLESGLLLAQVFRRRGQYERALDQLGHLQILDESLQWTVEIHREISLIQRDLEEDREDEEPLANEVTAVATTGQEADDSEADTVRYSDAA